ncbi:FAD-dependent oxidoreductase, partial [Mesorhizobium sp. M5C.F.Ca.IN.020.32.2.1]
MSAAKQVIVVGAGIIGASVAWHLAKAGADDDDLLGCAHGWSFVESGLLM